MCLSELKVAPRSLRASSEKDCFERSKRDQQIKARRHVLNIVKVVTKLFLGVLDRVPVLVADLGPPANPGANGMPQLVIGNLATQLLHKFRTFRPRTNHAHVASQNVKQ